MTDGRTTRPLLDLKPPKVHGLDVLREIKAHPRCGTIPVVVLATPAENRDVQTARQLGANSCIVKPVDFHKFVEVPEQIELYWTILNHIERTIALPEVNHEDTLCRRQPA